MKEAILRRLRSGVEQAKFAERSRARRPLLPPPRRLPPRSWQTEPLGGCWLAECYPLALVRLGKLQLELEPQLLLHTRCAGKSMPEEAWAACMGSHSPR